MYMVPSTLKHKGYDRATTAGGRAVRGNTCHVPVPPGTIETPTTTGETLTGTEPAGTDGYGRAVL